MNFKPNVWTLLFVLAMGALLFIMYDGGKTDVEVEEDKCSGTTLDTIKTLTAYEMRLGFQKYLSENSAFIDSAVIQGVVNPNVYSFYIPRCEFDQMVAKFPGGDVTAYLGMKNLLNGKRQIDLIFSDQANTSDVAELNKKILAAKGGDLFALGGGDSQYWDFTKPCPDSCEN